MNLAAFDSVEAAHRLQAFVERRGFAAQIHDDRKIQRYWFWVPPKAAIQVQVPEPTYETVRHQLEVLPGADAALQGAFRCPSCGSLRVQYPQMTRKFFLPTLVMQVLFLFHVVGHECYCESCQYTWAPEASASGPADQIERPAHTRGGV